jgi:hypothetical protein
VAIGVARCEPCWCELGEYAEWDFGQLLDAEECHAAPWPIGNVRERDLRPEPASRLNAKRSCDRVVTARFGSSEGRCGLRRSGQIDGRRVEGRATVRSRATGQLMFSTACSSVRCCTSHCA